MTDREKIRKELIRLKDKYYKRGEESDALRDGKGMYWGGVISAFNEVITLVEKLEEEPASEDLDKAANDFAFKRFADDKMAVKRRCVRIGYRAGAKWQKEQIINKACAYWERYFENKVFKIQCDKIIEDFRKAMEEEK